jgi:hypothetical protein
LDWFIDRFNPIASKAMFEVNRRSRCSS